MVTYAFALHSAKLSRIFTAGLVSHILQSRGRFGTLCFPNLFDQTTLVGGCISVLMYCGTLVCVKYSDRKIIFLSWKGNHLGLSECLLLFNRSKTHTVFLFCGIT